MFDIWVNETVVRKLPKVMFTDKGWFFLCVCVGGKALIQETTSQFGEFEDELSDNFESFMGVGDNNWEEWEEWMGWEGAGTYDYTNHINPDL